MVCAGPDECIVNITVRSFWSEGS